MSGIKQTIPLHYIAMSATLNYTTIFSNKFKYNEEGKQEELINYAKAQLLMLKDTTHFEVDGEVMVNKKINKYVITIKTDDLHYSPSKSGESFKKYLEQIDDESRENVDASHVLVLDKSRDQTFTAYPIRWAPNTKVKSTGGSWVLGCGKDSPKGSDQEMSSPDQSSSGKKHKSPSSRKLILHQSVCHYPS